MALLDFDHRPDPKDIAFCSSHNNGELSVACGPIERLTPLVQSGNDFGVIEDLKEVMMSCPVAKNPNHHCYLLKQQAKRFNKDFIANIEKEL